MQFVHGENLGSCSRVRGLEWVFELGFVAKSNSNLIFDRKWQLYVKHQNSLENLN